MYTRDQSKKCSKCGEALVVEHRNLVGLKDRHMPIMERYALVYRVKLSCPARLTSFGAWFRHGHDQQEITEEA